MQGTLERPDKVGVVHYFCEHHAQKEASAVNGGSIEERISIYLPVVLMYCVTIIAAVLLTVYKAGLSYHIWMLYFMGFTFLAFGLFKILDVSAFADGYQEYDIIAVRSRLYALAYPFIEILLAGLYLADFGGIYRDVFTLFLMSIGAVGVLLKLRKKEEVPCVCLGAVFQLPMTKVTLFENGVMALMALSMLPMHFAM